MIHNSYWTDELISLSNKIQYWKRKANKMLSSNIPRNNDIYQKAIHKLELNILISATIVRKILETENEYFTFCNRYKNSPFFEKPVKNKWYVLFNLHINVLKIPLKNDLIDDWAAYFKDFCIEDYNISMPQTESQKLNDICNWIIHSYVWSLGDIKNNSCISGFFVSSDRTKENLSCYVLIDDWINVLKYCAEKAYL